MFVMFDTTILCLTALNYCLQILLTCMSLTKVVILHVFLFTYKGNKNAAQTSDTGATSKQGAGLNTVKALIAKDSTTSKSQCHKYSETSSKPDSCTQHNWQEKECLIERCKIRSQ